jgi:predicted DNA-binding transcriptional regulator YafY
MRASRLLRILLALQNRGRLTTRQLAAELEVARRTILRDVDALTEAGLPIMVHRGNAGGIELGFRYRSRLVGLDGAEAEALGLMLTAENPALAELGVSAAAQRARDKLIESMPEQVRAKIAQAERRFRLGGDAGHLPDPRVAALANAVRDGAIARIRAKSRNPRTIHPVALQLGPTGWAVIDAQDPTTPIPIADVADINISARRFSLP